VPVAGSEYELPVDVVINAVGTNANPLLTATAPDLSLNKWGNIVADENGMTSLEGVFAGAISSVAAQPSSCHGRREKFSGRHQQMAVQQIATLPVNMFEQKRLPYLGSLFCLDKICKNRT
jgi:thioredoxin reductase